MTFDAEAAAIATYPHEHVGYDRPAPPNCRCDECYVNDQRRLAFVAGAVAALESGGSESGDSFPTCAICGERDVEDDGDHADRTGHWPRALESGGSR